ncbi:unnamed protein product [Urochloa humidicola]
MVRSHALEAQHISTDSYHHNGNGDSLRSDVDAPRPFSAAHERLVRHLELVLHCMGGSCFLLAPKLLVARWFRFLWPEFVFD